MKDKIKPIFVFSLPRSGSTLLQKILMTNPKINSVSEPWILLTYFCNLKDEISLSKFSQKICNEATKDFINNIGQDTYFKYLNDFIIKLYSETSEKDNIYFVDKTPRYYLIIPEIAKVFPKAKFIFLFRNPLSIYSSILNTWYNNRFLNHKHYIDLYEGPDYLLKGYKLLKNKSIKINYENLVNQPNIVLNQISEYIKLPYKEFNINEYFKSNLNGKMGDKKGFYNYDRISNSSIKKWKNNFNTNYRKHIAKNYINYLDNEFLDLTNIESTSIINEIGEIKSKKIGIKDYFYYNLSNIYRKFKLKFQVQRGKELFSKCNEKSLYF